MPLLRSVLLTLTTVLCLPDLADAGPDPLQRVWRDESGAWYSVIEDAQGELTIHPTASGRFYRYQIKDDGATAANGAPALSLAPGLLQLGQAQLRPAPLTSEWFDFEHAGLRLHGVLTLPQGPGPFALVVNAHGSGREAATGFDWAAAWYAQAGFATLIFDKRGTGQSGGEYSHDFELLAGDLLAAVRAASADPRIDARRVGVAGYSQGVYVATLAASRSPAIAFVIAGFGMTESPLREDLLETRLHFEAHYPQLQWEEFEPLVVACQQAFALRDDYRWREVKAHKRRWRGLVEADALAGTLTGDGCLRWGPTALKLFGRKRLPAGLRWDYDPQPVMAGLQQPVLWQFGSADVDAPPASSIALTRQWAASGKPMRIQVYEGATHGIYRQAVDAEGNHYRYKDPRYIADLVQWLRDLPRP